MKFNPRRPPETATNGSNSTDAMEGEGPVPTPEGLQPGQQVGQQLQVREKILDKKGGLVAPG